MDGGGSSQFHHLVCRSYPYIFRKINTVCVVRLGMCSVVVSAFHWLGRARVLVSTTCCSTVYVVRTDFIQHWIRSTAYPAVEIEVG
jgi:hypothetical protein